MTIQEAAVKERPLRRARWCSWLASEAEKARIWWYLTDEGKFVSTQDGIVRTLDREDYIATDWEVKP